jgi:hypothetical protein
MLEVDYIIKYYSYKTFNAKTLCCTRWNFVRNKYGCLLLFFRLRVFPVKLQLVTFSLTRLLDPLILLALTRKRQAVDLVR